jgi:putative transposase
MRRRLAHGRAPLHGSLKGCVISAVSMTGPSLGMDFLKNNCQLPQRRSVRLPGYDYTQAGAYFVTICTYQRECLLGEIIGAEMRLNEFGVVARDEWLRSAEIRTEIELDAFTVMPNHVHGIVVIRPSKSSSASSHVGAHGRAPAVRTPKSLGSFVAGFKSITTKKINRIRQVHGTPFWQRNFYERVIRNYDEWASLTQYIQNNAREWEESDEYWPSPGSFHNRWHFY